MRPERSLNWHLGWPDDNGPYPTSMVEKANKALKKPIQELTSSEIRLLIGQNMGLEYVVPLALEILASDPMIDATYYPGDLLSTCLNADREFWQKNSDLRKALTVTAISAQSSDGAIDTKIFSEIAGFQSFCADLMPSDFPRNKKPR